MASAPAARPGRALRALQASSQAAALRDEMKTLEQPAWMKLVSINVSMVGETKNKLKGKCVGEEKDREREIE